MKYLNNILAYETVKRNFLWRDLVSFTNSMVDINLGFCYLCIGAIALSGGNCDPFKLWLSKMLKIVDHETHSL
jgi:hypothetical protein